MQTTGIRSTMHATEHALQQLLQKTTDMIYAVNIGDGLARWTDGLLKSTYHRVRAPKITDNKVQWCTNINIAHLLHQH